MKKTKAIIAIPAYKKDPTEFEKISFIQCCKVLGKHTFSLVCPNDLDISVYEKIFNSYNINFTIARFENDFFESAEKYNCLMLSIDFYKKFEEYEFMLVYQLDAYVFRSELDYWCEKDFDYIGAPWFENFSLSNANSKLLDIAGNGGFSLRKISSFVKVLNHTKKTAVFIREYIRNGQNEDVFFAKFAKNIKDDFKVANSKEAMHFSFECQPRKLYEMIDNKLPFGCHGWERYDFDFWESFINLEGVDFREENKANLKKLSSMRDELDQKKGELKYLYAQFTKK